MSSVAKRIAVTRCCLAVVPLHQLSFSASDRIAAGKKAALQQVKGSIVAGKRQHWSYPRMLVPPAITAEAPELLWAIDAKSFMGTHSL